MRKALWLNSFRGCANCMKRAIPRPEGGGGGIGIGMGGGVSATVVGAADVSAVGAAVVGAVSAEVDDDDASVVGSVDVAVVEAAEVSVGGDTITVDAEDVSCASMRKSLSPTKHRINDAKSNCILYDLNKKNQYTLLSINLSSLYRQKTFRYDPYS